MLVLSRQKDETIMIGDDVEITVVDIRGDKVRLGISAPPHIPVHRKEVYDAIKRENRAASQITPEDIGSVTTSSNDEAPRGRRNGGPSSSRRPGNKPGGNTSRQRRADGPADSNNVSRKTNSGDTDPGSEGILPDGK